MEGFNSAWFIAAAIGIVLLGLDWVIPDAVRDSVGWILLTVGSIFLVVGFVGLGRSIYVKDAKKAQTTTDSSNTQKQPATGQINEQSKLTKQPTTPASNVSSKEHPRNKPESAVNLSGGISQGPGSIAQIGGSQNSAIVNNYGTTEWHLSEQQKATFGDFAETLPAQTAETIVIGDIPDRQSQTYASDLFNVLAAHHRVNRRGHILSMDGEFPKGVEVGVHDLSDGSLGTAERIVSEMRREGIPVSDVGTSDEIQNHEIHIIVGLMPPAITPEAPR